MGKYKNKNKSRLTTRNHKAELSQSMEVFTFGEPTAVLDRRDILDYVECINNGQWYEPPVSLSGLAKSMRAAVHHSSPIYVKRNILSSTFIPHPLLSQQDFSRFLLDFLVFGNAFLEMRKNITDKVFWLDISPAKYTRRGAEEDTYWYIQNLRSHTSLNLEQFSTYWSLISTKNFMGCLNTSVHLIRLG